MTKKKEFSSFEDRNTILKKYKSSSTSGWTHLILAQENSSGKKFLRLKKYLNWFSIKNARQLRVVQELLLRGAAELEWVVDESLKIDVNEESTTEKPISTLTQNVDVEIPEEIIELFEAKPELVSKILSLPFEINDFNYVFDIFQVIDDLILSGSERLKVAFKEIIEKISKEEAKGMQELSDLMDKLNLLQIASVTNLVKKRLETIDLFEDMIQNEQTFEINTDKSIHRVLEKNMWIIDENLWIATSNKSLRNFIGDEILKKHKNFSKKRPDFACVDFENKLIILEIKRPSIELKKIELDQAELYHRIIKQYKSTDYRNISVILIGNKISSEAQEILELRKGVEIKTYNDFLSKCRKRYKNYLDVLDN